MTHIVFERGADLGDQIREIRLDHEGAGPERFLQRRFRQRLGPAFDELEEEGERLGRDVISSAPRRSCRVSGSSVNSPKCSSTRLRGPRRSRTVGQR